MSRRIGLFSILVPDYDDAIENAQTSEHLAVGKIDREYMKGIKGVALAMAGHSERALEALEQARAGLVEDVVAEVQHLAADLRQLVGSSATPGGSSAPPSAPSGPPAAEAPSPLGATS